MRVDLLTLATAHEKWADEASALYQKKISHFFNFQKIELKGSKNSRAQGDKKRHEDSDIIRTKIAKEDFVILLDEKGLNLNSRGFAKKFEGALNSGKKRILLIIGGPFGVDEDIKAKAHLVLSLSPLTFNHLLAETVLLEQVYRAMTILKNIPYHND